MIFYPTSKIQGEIDNIPADKSIYHRAVILASLIDKPSEIYNIPNGQDCLSTDECMKKLGTKIIREGNKCFVKGNNFYECSTLNAGNSGTTMRLLSGILSSLPFISSITGDESLKKRPMERIIQPLTQLGAKITSSNGKAPLTFYPSKLHATSYRQIKASAQVKSCFLLASLNAEGTSSYIEPIPTRDHLEKLLLLSGAKLNKIGDKIEITGNAKLNSFKITIPADISSASFFIASALLSKNGNVKIKNVGINEHRIGFLNAVKKMNGFIEIQDIRSNEAGEPIGNIIAKTSNLKAIEIEAKDVPSMIDEIPILAVLATQAEGKTKITGAGELRKKESDRIFSMCSELKKMGANIKEFEDGFEIDGRTRLKGAELESHGDHRVAMSLIIASTIADSPCEINGVDCINISYPNFIETLEKLTK